jgi:hypothetical protein
MRTKRTKTDELILFDRVRGDEKDENPLGFVLFVLTLRSHGSQSGVGGRRVIHALGSCSQRIFRCASTVSANAMFPALFGNSTWQPSH